MNLKVFYFWNKRIIFAFYNILQRQIAGVAIVFSLGPSVAHAFLAYHEQNWSGRCPLQDRPLYYQRYVDDRS